VMITADVGTQVGVVTVDGTKTIGGIVVVTVGTVGTVGTEIVDGITVIGTVMVTAGVTGTLVGMYVGVVTDDGT
jgi:hypothetical protein